MRFRVLISQRVRSPIQRRAEKIYSTGQGTIKLRGTTKVVTKGSQRILQVTSIPFGVNKAAMVERIAEIIFSGKLPLVTEVRDLSTDEIRVDLLLKKGADENKVLAYLHKHTQLQNNFNVNLTCLVPTENPEVGAPNRLSLKEVLWHFALSIAGHYRAIDQ